MSGAAGITALLEIMVRLRDPIPGCPWDREQDFRSIAPHTLEEAYEVADAIEREDMNDLRDELGDLLFQVVFHARMAEESGYFDFNDVARGVSEKLVRRHPHVFGTAQMLSAEEQHHAWGLHAATAIERGHRNHNSRLADDVVYPWQSERRGGGRLHPERLRRRERRTPHDPAVQVTGSLGCDGAPL